MLAADEDWWEHGGVGVPRPSRGCDDPAEVDSCIFDFRKELREAQGRIEQLNNDFELGTAQRSRSPFAGLGNTTTSFNDTVQAN